MSVILHHRDRWGVCKCGHYQWQHSDSIKPDLDTPVEIWGREDGHGGCGFEDCDCKQFTWDHDEERRVTLNP